MKLTKISFPVWKKNEPLALHTYIKLGGPADFFTVVKSADELAGTVIDAEEAGVPWFILGGGSNILVGDLGFRGLVIKNEADKIATGRTEWYIPRNDGLVTVTAESGALLSQLASFAIDHGLAGLEPFMSVPGTVGGAIFNNSHFRPSQNEFIGNLVEEAEILFPRATLDDVSSMRSARNPRSLRRRLPVGEKTKVLSGSSSMISETPSSVRPVPFRVSRDWFRFSYDYSRLQEEKAVVLRVKFKLEKGDPEELRSKSLELLKQRNSYQPIGSLSCGCMWRNPKEAPAGKLIDETGLKGIRVGGMSVSQTHANFMVNDGTGKVGDVLELMARVKKRVKKYCGVELEPEIFMVGEFSHENMKT